MREIGLASRRLVLGTFLVTAGAMLPALASAQESNKELITALRPQHVALAAGIEAAAATGKPISAKYEYEGGKLQLSVYTENAGAFSEVIVDHKTGKITKIEKITAGDDLKDAQAQSAASAKAKVSISRALQKALAENSGYSAVSAAATLKAGRPFAEVTLLKGSDLKTVTQPLD